MKSIFKYRLEVTTEQLVEMPTGAQLLDVQLQHQSLHLWAVVDSSKPFSRRIIRIFGTGNPTELIDLGEYVTTVQQHQFVWHVFDGGEV